MHNILKGIVEGGKGFSKYARGALLNNNKIRLKTTGLLPLLNLLKCLVPCSVTKENDKLVNEPTLDSPISVCTVFSDQNPLVE